ncbi:MULTISPECIES: DUF3331 domain-containing protein [Paraburkholderia]|uniref:DUF3331 domain-containing protein n=1 Tax=Paraburkholderia TaxID=1822464 RepID=UPI0038BD36B7
MTVARLGDGAVSERVDPRTFASTGSFVPGWEGSPGMSIVRVLDEPTDQTLTVSWRDARSGYYGYPRPTWRAVVAKVPDTCVLTGRLTKVGDAMYKPRFIGQAPANAGAMICATSVDTSKQPI